MLWHTHFKADESTCERSLHLLFYAWKHIRALYRNPWKRQDIRIQKIHAVLNLPPESHFSARKKNFSPLATISSNASCGDKKRVYIVFGDEDFYADEIRTDYEGKFKFSYLYPGDYRLYTYSECSPIDPCDSDVRKVEIQIKIRNNGDVVVTDDLITENW